MANELRTESMANDAMAQARTNARAADGLHIGRNFHKARPSAGRKPAERTSTARKVAAIVAALAAVASWVNVVIQLAEV